jgi:hypothetical protein
MFKYGDPNNILSITSNTRNLTFNNNLKTSSTSNTSNNSLSNITNTDNANINDLYINTLSVIPNSLNPFIIVSSPFTISFLKASYESNDFNIYPIYFSEDIKINNNNFILNSLNVEIFDNIILINSELNNIIINNYQYNNIISGIIFPIPDQNLSTGYYSGLLYFPNNKLELINGTLYKWNNLQYNYFNNNNKGFFKLPYIPSTINLKNNEIDSNYFNLINNNNNLSNLIINSIGLYDGEITGLNTELFFNLSDSNIIYKLINLTKYSINIYNNLSIHFEDNLIIKDNNIEYLNFSNSIITIYQNILLNNNLFSINSLYNSILTIDSSLNIIHVLSNLSVNNLIILINLELNNIPIVFVNILNIQSSINNTIFMTFNSLPNTITFYVPTYINNLIVNNQFELLNNIPLIFNQQLYIQDINSNNYIYFNSITNQISFLVPTYLNYIYINSSFNLLNNIPIIINDYLTIRNNNINIINFTNNYTTIYNNLFIYSNNIYFNSNNTLNISDISNTINLQINSTITINGPNKLSTNIVNSSFNITNTVNTYINVPFIPYYKTYITSGITDINQIITFKFLEVTNLNNMSGKLIGTTYILNNVNVNSYEINLWTFPNNTLTESLVNFNTLNPYNTNNIGDWSINNIYLSINSNNSYDLNIDCNGSLIDTVIWSFKLDILQI